MPQSGKNWRLTEGVVVPCAILEMMDHERPPTSVPSHESYRFKQILRESDQETRKAGENGFREFLLSCIPDHSIRQSNENKNHGFHGWARIKQLRKSIGSGNGPKDSECRFWPGLSV